MKRYMAGFAFFKGGEGGGWNRNPPPKIQTEKKHTNHFTNKTNMVISELIEEFHDFLIKTKFSNFRVLVSRSFYR